MESILLVRRNARCSAACWLIAVVVSCGGLAAVGCGRVSESMPPLDTQPRPAGSVAGITPQSVAEIKNFCGDCHALPLATSFPRDRWAKEVRQGYEFYLESGRSDLKRPVERDAIRFFAGDAPERLETVPVSRRREFPTNVDFREQMLAPGVFDVTDPAVAHIVWRPGKGDFLASDMRSGAIYRIVVAPQTASMNVLATIKNPCRITAWPQAASEAHVIADLGTFMPVDHQRGGVWLVQEADDSVAVVPLMENLSRVVEVQPLDCDGDGDHDLVVAEFGWRQSGALRLLRFQSDGTYNDTVLDARHGAVAVRVVDLDCDGSDDIVAAFGQEHETVDVYWGDGSGGFLHETIHSLPDPSWGTSSFEVVDIDSDGFPDLVHANGDTLDSGLAKPYHGIRLLRNRGRRRFEAVHVGSMVGACQASVGDIDGDGDLDIVACSLFQAASAVPPGTYDALTWFEQLPDGSFSPHSIAKDTCEHVAFSLADVDGDGRVDVVAGVWKGTESEERWPLVKIYRNVPSGNTLFPQD